MTGLQKSVQSNPSRGGPIQENIIAGASSGIINKEKVERIEREGSVDANSSYNVHAPMRHHQRGREPEGSEAKDGSYHEKSNSLVMVNEYNNRDAVSNEKGYDVNAAGNNMSPRGGISNNLQKMNVMNFIKPKKEREEKSSDSRFMGQIDHRETQDYQKAINRQGSKKMIQGTHMNQFSQNSGFNLGNQFMQNKLNLTKNINITKNSGSRGEYEYDIDITNNIKKMNNAGANSNNLGDSVGSNPGSVVGHYNDDGSQGNQYASIVGVGSNISVKKSMMKI